MNGINEKLEFCPVRIAVLIVSDTRTTETDTSGAVLVQRIETAGHVVVERLIVPDDVTSIRDIVSTWIADPGVDVVISSGGTGLTGRDVTPEAVTPFSRRRSTGFP